MEGYHEDINEKCSGRETIGDITHMDEKKKEDLQNSELEKKRKSNEEDDLVDNFFNGKLNIHNKRIMTFSDVKKLAFKPSEDIPYTRAMKYLYEMSIKSNNLFKKLSPLRKELNDNKRYYDVVYQDLKKDGDPGYFEFYDDFKQRYLKYNCYYRFFNSIIYYNLYIFFIIELFMFAKIILD